MNDHAAFPDPDDADATFVPDDQAGSTRREEMVGRADPFATFLPAAGPSANTRPVSYDALVRGDQIGDFRILRLLGRGGFGAVYLARELTLDRLVAVKVVLPHGQRASSGEGRNLARLKHPGIVGVFGEAHDKRSGCSLLWMQFVDGCNLASLIEQLHQQDREEDWNELDLLRLLDPSEFQDRDRPQRATRSSVETVCRIGRQLAEALSHAHQSGISHRDIKPANILMQRDGTPLLADFNLADDANDDHELESGGTIAYMPPEQFAHCLDRGEAYDACRADIYALGLVLWELATGSRPFADAESKVTSSGGRRLLDLLAIRRREFSRGEGDPPIGLSMVLRRAMAIDPEKRYPSAKGLAASLNGLSELYRARRQSPVTAGVVHFVRVHLFWIILIGGLLPHLAASAFQSMYNVIWIGTGGEAFTKAFVAYNVVVYPACVGWLAWNLYQFARGYRRVVAREPIARGEIRKLRGRLMRLPRQFMIASAVGWFPGVILFPWLLGVFGEPPSTNEWFHYGISFAIAGLIATTYSYAVVLYIVVCHGYRACWQEATHYRERARYELSGMQRRIRRVSILVGVLPLAAAVLLLSIGLPEMRPAEMIDMTRDQLVRATEAHGIQMQQMNHLVTALIVLGAIGLYVVETAAARLIRCVAALTLADD